MQRSTQDRRSPRLLLGYLVRKFGQGQFGRRAEDRIAANQAHLSAGSQLGFDFAVECRPFLLVHFTAVNGAGVLNAAGVVQAQHQGLSACAGTTPRNAAQGIALDFDRPAFAGFHQYGAVITAQGKKKTQSS